MLCALAANVHSRPGRQSPVLGVLSADVARRLCSFVIVKNKNREFADVYAEVLDMSVSAQEVDGLKEHNVQPQ